ncbi:hypothetical protein Pst134EA_032013 [Puccinia striiformis f. sp. tritici]|uniref:uncharacterized protein n=1 Tax=Puccinia striiformis f. sp. tritici TaxID=168172 RepID=UPI0020075A37|nr:uncharacterized protein Pst134EA_032013 [Puccinia striiformis f. sp. tritici]KAH9444376.1 hypothetical protein Pst134EA_032013 [Puccinia striiformis f. sp. tritici]
MAEEPASMASTTSWITTMKLTQITEPINRMSIQSQAALIQLQTSNRPNSQDSHGSFGLPLGFAMVAPGVYRFVIVVVVTPSLAVIICILILKTFSSGHPNHCNFAFDGLQLKSIILLSTTYFQLGSGSRIEDISLPVNGPKISETAGEKE